MWSWNSSHCTSQTIPFLAAIVNGATLLKRIALTESESPTEIEAEPRFYIPLMRLRRGETVPRPVFPTDSRVWCPFSAGDHLRRPRRLSPPSPLRARAPLRSGCRSTPGAQIITEGLIASGARTLDVSRSSTL